MSAGFEFNTITLESAADITKVAENFDKIETNGITYEDAKAQATTTADGVMSKEDKAKLDGIASGAQVNNITSVKLNGTAQTINNGELAMSETDPTVPSWAKMQNKPSYTWNEIGSKPTLVTQSTVSNFWLGSQSQYDAITTKDTTTMYMIYEEAD